MARGYSMEHQMRRQWRPNYCFYSSIYCRCLPPHSERKSVAVSQAAHRRQSGDIQDYFKHSRENRSPCTEGENHKMMDPQSIRRLPKRKYGTPVTCQGVSSDGIVHHALNSKTTNGDVFLRFIGGFTIISSPNHAI